MRVAEMIAAKLSEPLDSALKGAVPDPPDFGGATPAQILARQQLLLPFGLSPTFAPVRLDLFAEREGQAIVTTNEKLALQEHAGVYEGQATVIVEFCVLDGSALENANACEARRSYVVRALSRYVRVFADGSRITNCLPADNGCSAVDLVGGGCYGMAKFGVEFVEAVNLP